MEVLKKYRIIIIIVLFLLAAIAEYYINIKNVNYLDLTDKCNVSCSKKINGFGEVEVDSSKIVINSWPIEVNGAIKRVYFMKNALLVQVDNSISIYDVDGKEVFKMNKAVFENGVEGNILGKVETDENKISFLASAVENEEVKFPLYTADIYNQDSWRTETGATVVEEEYIITYNHDEKTVTILKQKQVTIASLYIAKYGSLEKPILEPVILDNKTEVDVTKECTSNECQITMNDFGKVVIKNNGELEDEFYISNKLISNESEIVALKLIDEVLIVEKHVGSDIVGTSIAAYKKDGSEIFNYKEINFPSNEKGFIQNVIIGDKITFDASLVAHEGFTYKNSNYEVSEKSVWEKSVPENLVIDGTCTIKYLGNGEFSSLKFASGKTLIEFYNEIKNSR